MGKMEEKHFNRSKENIGGGREAAEGEEKRARDQGGKNPEKCRGKFNF